MKESSVTNQEDRSFAASFADPASSSYHQPLLDRRRRRVRGIWIHQGVFYGRLYGRTADGRKIDRRIRLASTTLSEARQELNQRKAGAIASLAVSPAQEQGARPPAPTLREFKAIYSQRAQVTKRVRTTLTEGVHLRHWVRGDLGNTRLDELTKAQVLRFRDERLRAGWSPRTANLSLTVLRNLLQCARDEGVLFNDPTSGIRPLRHVARKRPLFTTEQIEHLASTAEEACPRSGKAFSNYILLMSFSGARCSEAIRLRWADVDWTARQLVIGSDGLTKNHETRRVDFNDRLEALLSAMLANRKEGAEFLFGLDRRPSQGQKTFRQTLEKVRAKTQECDFGFHDCRHHFASYCVMSGVDYLTIARWLGHRDGGVLIGKVYGHLNAEHLRRAASRVQFAVGTFHNVSLSGPDRMEIGVLLKA